MEIGSLGSHIMSDPKSDISIRVSSECKHERVVSPLGDNGIKVQGIRIYETDG